MTNASRPEEPWWNLDQALLWIATRNMEWVRGASIRVRHRPDTWIGFRMHLLGDERASLLAPSDVQDLLIFAIQDSSLLARVDGHPLDPAWAYEVTAVEAGEDEMRAYLKRRRWGPTRLEGEPKLTAEPQFLAADMMAKWPIWQLPDDVVDTIQAPDPGRYKLLRHEDIVTILEAWWHDKVAGNLDAKNRPTNDDALAAVQATHPWASRNPVIEAWKEVRERLGSGRDIVWETRGRRSQKWKPSH